MTCRAREILHEWTGLDTVGSEIVRHTLIHAVVASHRHVFGVFFWYVLPLGPAGAVLYRISEYLARSWSTPGDERTAAFSTFAQRAFFVIDWIPSRLTALGFAIVGNFEDAIYAWRNHAPVARCERRRPARRRQRRWARVWPGRSRSRRASTRSRSATAVR
jgi:adenosylcobinamide-phosphate synthase